MQNKSYRFKLGRLSLLFLFVGMLVVSCKKDDDVFTPVPIRDRAEQQIADNDSIVKFLESYYFDSNKYNANPSIENIDIVKIIVGQELPDGAIVLSDTVNFKTLYYMGVEYNIGVLDLQNYKDEEGYNSPTFADNVLVKYEGFNLNNNIFDSALSPIQFDLADLIIGWGQVLPDFNVAQSFSENVDGTVTYVNPGIGVMFLPSGVAYFERSVSGIAAYTPIAFKFELLHSSQNDHDNDGVPSYLEDLFKADGTEGSDGIFTIGSNSPNDDDTDNDGKLNFVDNDDDGDGILTIHEYKDEQGNIIMSSNGIPKYLDPLE